MSQLEHLRPEDVNRMTYNELIAIVRETNRPPGGRKSLLSIAQKTRLGQGQRVLEIGTATGFSAIELSRYTRARIHAIDLNPLSIQEAQRRAHLHRAALDITFEIQDATNLSFADETFHLVLCGNVTSLITNRSKALAEYIRVLKPDGYVAAIPMYYLQPPPPEVVSNVSQAIGVDIEVHYRNYWMNFFVEPPLEIFDIEDYHFDKISPETVETFVLEITSRPHLNAMPNTTRATLVERYTAMMELFRVNLSYMGFSILLLRKESEPTEPELFTSSILR
jgi:SAM-dependent methyltransferase